MRIWQFWWRSLLISIQYNPPWFIELVMLCLALILLMVWAITKESPYVILSLSYVVGSSISVLIRESFFPSPQPRLTQVMAALLLIFSLFGLFDLVRTL